MPNLTGGLQVSVHALICLAILMLGFAEGELLPYVVTIPIVLFSLFGAKRWPRAHLPTAVANLLGLLVFSLAASRLFADQIESRLLAGAHLLVYLTWIVLLQAKRFSQYWWLFALAVLQIAVGAILTSNGLYGLFLVVFLMTAIWTLTIFSLQQAAQRFAPEKTADLIKQTSASEQGEATKPLAAPKTAGQLLVQSSTAVASIEHDSADRWFNMRFAFGIAGMTGAALVIAMLFFLFVPRRWIGRQAWASSVSRLKGETLVGFTESVQLGDIGKILGSNRRVMEVRMFDHDSGDSIEVETYSAQLGYDEPLFRGQVLDYYVKGGWRRTQSRRSPTRDVDSDPARGLIRQEIRLVPIGTNVLFSVQPVPIRGVPAARYTSQSADQNEEIRFQSIGSILARKHSSSQRKRIVYEVFTRKPNDANTEAAFGVQTPDERSEFRYLQFPGAQLSRLEAEARRISGVDQVKRATRGRVAEKLVSYLRDTGGFSYSLDAKRENYSIDPVEEFLVRKTGHCEYFASALTLMLRAVGIPSRIVSGFKGGTKNKITGYYEIEERHAHTWVEALIDGHWIVLDATPADERQQSIDGLGHSLRSWQDVVNFVSDLWNSYVVDINLGSQQKKLYDPMKKSAVDVWNAVVGGEGGSTNRLQALKEFLMNPKMWFSWRGGLIAFVLMVAICGFVWGVRRIAALVRRFDFRKNSQARRRRLHIAFYERFRELCAKMGMVRTPAQTQREFARDVSEKLARGEGVSGGSSQSAVGARDVPRELAEVFYGVRFGEQSLSESRAAEIDRQLSQWERQMNSARGTASASG